MSSITHRSPALAQHFDDLAQQRRAATLGMWVFLSTELMLFGGLFGSYIVYRYLYPTAFAEAGTHMAWGLGSINTVVLISSSFTAVLAVYGAQTQSRGIVLIGVALTILLGLTFLGIKSYEYYIDYEEQLIPGYHFNESMWVNWTETRFTPAMYILQVKMFFVLYFIMTGLHAVHMIGGMTALTCLFVGVWREQVQLEDPSLVENIALYWHFVDVIWIFLLPLLYLNA